MYFYIKYENYFLYNKFNESIFKFINYFFRQIQRLSVLFFVTRDKKI